MYENDKKLLCENLIKEIINLCKYNNNIHKCDGLISDLFIASIITDDEAVIIYKICRLLREIG